MFLIKLKKFRKAKSFAQKGMIAGKKREQKLPEVFI